MPHPRAPIAFRGARGLFGRQAMQDGSLSIEHEGDYRLVLEGRLGSFELAGQENANVAVYRKFLGIVDSPLRDPAPHFKITIEVDPDR